ncbi:mannitol dehydrogenase family protein [Altererythrobacter lutimaris]|uniref:Mannitol dehydrogenase family protein n=1 Tax=Altererythrobacter lutimaris TaxID=2743979 RepID=A0A850H9B7_9SPHN|nr:mannitol dehydrogenase family protein [Altererythrobacter lutimaris]
MTRLSSTTLHGLPASVDLPGYDRTGPCGIVHLGTGAFHRAHQAVYFDALLNAGHEGWMIQGSSLRSATVAEQLNPQDGLFATVVRDGEEEKLRVIGSLKGVLVAPHVPAALVDALADPAVALVTLTVTEKGYCIDPASGDLRRDDPSVAADITDLSRPSTAPGFLVAGLAARRASGVAPFTVLSCDNLPDNGKRTRAAVIELAKAVDQDLADWIEREVAFPSSMVDRIVPATVPDDLDRFETATRLRDEALVKTEPFTQWVVEDWFCNRRPPLEELGVQMTDDVAAWEMAKLRLLNGAHSALAYLGGMAGHTFVDQAMAAPGFAHLIDVLWDEAEATLEPIDEFDPEVYRAELAKRFGNSALQHRTHQIAMDGSQKLPQRWLNTIRAYRAKSGEVPKALCLALAGWMHWQGGKNDAGERHQVDDPLARKTAEAIANAAGNSRQAVANLFALSEIFGSDLSRDEQLVAQVTENYLLIEASGAAHAVSQFGQHGLVEA